MQHVAIQEARYRISGVMSADSVKTNTSGVLGSAIGIQIKERE